MKDRFTLFTILGALGCVFVSMFLEGSNPMVLFKPAPLLLVFGGTTCVALAGYLKSDVGVSRACSPRPSAAPLRT